MLNTLLTGLTAGSAYGLVAVGLVLVYKTTRTFNFAQAEIGTVGGYAAHIALTAAGISYNAALLIGLLTGGALGGLMELLVIRPLARAPRATILVATAAVTTSIVALETILVGDSVRTLPPVISWAGIRIGSYQLSGSHLAALGAVLLTAAVGVWFFARTMLGAAIEAASNEPFGAQVVGIPVRMVSSVVWIIAGILSAMAGLLLAPLQSLSPGWLTANGLLGAFAAMVIGGMSSLGGALLGGILVGVVEALAFEFAGWAIPGAASLAVFLVLTAVLAFRPHGLFLIQVRRGI
jgi:branched-chain amino acid transport system permease protein